MRVAFFEDRPALKFGPIAQLRPVFDLVCGHFSLRERAIRHVSVNEWGVFLRDALGESFRELHPESHVNDFDWLHQGPTLFLNGGWVASAEALAQIDPHTAGILDGTVVHLTVEA